MSTIRQLANEFEAQPHEVRAFAGDVIPEGLSDVDDLPEDAETTIREAWAAAPQLDGE